MSRQAYVSAVTTEAIGIAAFVGIMASVAVDGIIEMYAAIIAGTDTTAVMAVAITANPTIRALT